MDHGLMANFKAYYMRTFKQFMKGIDREDNPIVRKIWKKFKMYVKDNMVGSRDEVKVTNLKDTWTKLVIMHPCH